MADVIKIKNGLTINLKGKAEKKILPTIRPHLYAVCPADFPGLAPKLSVKEGDRVLAGTPVLYDKNHPEVKIVSPVSGQVAAVNRGEKRKILEVAIVSDKEYKHLDIGKKDPERLSAGEIKRSLAEAGLFPFIRQRPYDVVANPDDTPDDLFVSGIFSAPLAPDIEFLIERDLENFRTGLLALSKLTRGNVYLAVRPGFKLPLSGVPANLKVVYFEGPHPVGNVGVQINRIRPINKGDLIWTINPADILFVGRLFTKGIVDLTRLVALTGSEIRQTGYHLLLPGASIEEAMKGNVNENRRLRYISGNVLTGKQIRADGALDYYSNQLTVIPEGDDVHEFLGWAAPGLRTFSFSRTFLSSLFGSVKKKEVVFDARLKGGRRAMIMSNEYDRVFPMDILPEYLLKAIIAFDVDKMENLGIYEVAPEDFALCEFVDTSKMELQQIVRTGLDLLRKEMS